MKLFKTFLPIIFCIWMVLSLAAIGSEFLIMSESGENFVIDVDQDESFLNVMQGIKGLLQDKQDQGFIVESLDEDYRFEYTGFFTDFFTESKVPKKTFTRNYYDRLTKAQWEDISYIVKILGYKSLVKILTLKGKVEAAGDRVQIVHPFRFLECLFTDEKNKAGVHNIKERGGWVCKDFMAGIHNTLEEEANNDNLKMEFIIDFAKIVGIDVNLIYGPIQERRWKDLVDVLITYIPREGDPTRYDM